MVRTYLDWLVTVPWSVSTDDNLDIKHARSVLDEDHFDLEKVKERILEFLAVRKLKRDTKGPILCFVGPPGIGKTSLGRSIARALGAKFVRLSLGGIRDEAEIRGHRRTYIGSLPGRIIQGLRNAGSNNPLFILDEVDKLGTDFRGDPASALLEVLDPEQNHSFGDHYLDVPFDLSQGAVHHHREHARHRFRRRCATAWKCIELPGYTEEEKLEIAERHLVPKQLKENGLGRPRSSSPRGAASDHPQLHARGRRAQPRTRNRPRLPRRSRARSPRARPSPSKITPDDLRRCSARRAFFSGDGRAHREPGVATGLAWTPSAATSCSSKRRGCLGKKALSSPGSSAT